MNLVTVFTAVGVNEVSFVKSLLESSGIKTVVLDETIGQIAPHYLFGQGGVRLAVAEADTGEAREIIKNYEDDKNRGK